MMVKDGFLQKRLSLLKGYKPQWFVLADDGYLNYFSEKPKDEAQKPKGKMLLLLSDTMIKKDKVSFTVTSASNNVFRLRADSSEKRNKWVEAINDVRVKLYNRMFKGFYGNGERQLIETDLDQENDRKEIDDVAQQDDDGIIAVAETNIASLFQTRTTPFLAVGAIDFGTTYSGCAFSTVQNFKTNPLQINTFQLDHKNVSSFKTPTVLLLTPEGKFHSFGATAESHYVTLARKEEANEWYYFNRFKMELYKNKELRRNMVLNDVGGKPMKAMLVFAFCIEFIKDLVLDKLKASIHGLEDDDVHWVVTVPAIWNEQARQFMIEASAKAGIEKDNLTLALEPECAAMFCRYLAIDKKKDGDEMELKAFDENARFMVVDLGGGTIDITMSEVLSTDNLEKSSLTLHVVEIISMTR
ncbi:Hypothetical predicted protein [Mytilus galloprovincialis]|uniref:PH domain-containing protein n=1 Tax=Mytilus galloprovincialis TaxID=29158 RepID=A0A8B6HQC3_MYTGA|nr:Hypothetical predicted protein [Mytilus galloprovincialis]